MNEKPHIMDVIDRMHEHVAAIDHLTNTADGSIGACLHMLERELQTTNEMLEDFRLSLIDEENQPPPKTSIREMIREAAAR